MSERARGREGRPSTFICWATNSYLHCVRPPLPPSPPQLTQVDLAFTRRMIDDIELSQKDLDAYVERIDKTASAHTTDFGAGVVFLLAGIAVYICIGYMLRRNG